MTNMRGRALVALLPAHELFVEGISISGNYIPTRLSFAFSKGEEGEVAEERQKTVADHRVYTYMPTVSLSAHLLIRTSC